MANESPRTASHRSAVDAVRDAESFAMTLPLVGRVTIPRPEQLAYFAGLAALAALEIIEWPVALIVASGHVLAEQHHNRLAQELGEAIEDA